MEINASSFSVLLVSVHTIPAGGAMAVPSYMGQAHRLAKHLCMKLPWASQRLIVGDTKLVMLPGMERCFRTATRHTGTVTNP